MKGTSVSLFGVGGSEKKMVWSRLTGAIHILQPRQSFVHGLVTGVVHIVQTGSLNGLPKFLPWSGVEIFISMRSLGLGF